MATTTITTTTTTATATAMTTATRSDDDTRSLVRTHYAEVARTNGACGCGPRCCAPSETAAQLESASLTLGYDVDELAALPEGANMGLGCGTPLAFAALHAGEIVLDLGSGGGIDCLLAARRVGDSGRVIGVDMTPAMLVKARANAGDARNVEFRLGEIEHLPVLDRSVDVIVSNCVVNLAPDKAAVFREALRVLKPGGRIAIADIVASAPLPESLRADAGSLSSCVAGAAAVDDVRALLRDAGFVDVAVVVDERSRSFIRDWLPGSGAEAYVASARITARRPSGDGCCGTTPSAGCC